jgi:hypothetical protein
MNAKTIFSATALAALLLATAAGLVAAAGDPGPDWWVVAGGGGTSSGGDFQVEGTAGQAAAGVVSGGPYQLGSGFWGGGTLTRAVYGIHLPIVVRRQ